MEKIPKNMNKLIICKGLQASGKSTWAKTMVDQGYKRVSKDDLRAMVDNGKWSKKNEEAIKDVEAMIANQYLTDGFSVVVDDTNFAYEDFWKEVAERKGAEFEVKFFDIPLGECIERDAKRGDKSVGAQVICSMYERYLHKEVSINPSLPKCYIFDIDGTLAKMNGRSPYDYTKVNTDIINLPVVFIYKMLKMDDNIKIFIFSGREDSCKTQTIDWLAKWDIFYDGLFMRPEGDRRKDSVIKTELYKEHIEGKFNVLGVFDDRKQVCRTWYSLGLPLFRVGNPDSDF